LPASKVGRRLTETRPRNIPMLASIKC
jgi:hypothetical protein